MAELAVREALALVEEVIIILYQKFERPTTLHDDVEKVQNILEMMHECVRESEDGIDDNRQLFLEVAHHFEDALDEFMLQLVTDEALNHISQDTADDRVAEFIKSWKPSCKLSSDIEEIIEKNTSFVERLDSLLQNHVSEGRSRSRLGDSLTFPYHDLAEGDQVVGFGELQEKLFKQLTEEDSKLLTIFIVGPGGSGKSTLVKNVFKSEEVQRFFDCKDWVPVPRGPLQLNELLLDMLTRLEKEKPALVEQVDDPKAKLRLFLQQKRYLVVLDDVWRKQDLQYIVKALPNGFHGSRIIITSRNSDVASFLSPKYIHDLSSGLSSEKAKDLFFSKAFHSNERYLCPPVLEKCSSEILKWCGGLPLAISEVGTLLAEKPRYRFVWDWEEFRESLATEIRPGSSLSIISSILEPSYMNLPNHLKTCFLYLGVFPAYHHIQSDRLIRLWVAEGFVKPKRGITVEQVARGYLNELIARNLVLIVSKWTSNWQDYGPVPRCCVVNLVRDFIISKAENFITVLEPNCSTTSTSVEKIRRLSVHGAYHHVDLQLFSCGLDLKHIRTLLVFANCSHSDLETVLKTSKFVRVLDLKCISGLGECFPKSVDDLILLKYLSLTGREITVPKSIRKLRFLETLELDPVVEVLPEEICELYTLRHLLVYSRDAFWNRDGVKFSGGNIGALSSMQWLALIDVRIDRIIIKALGELKDLKQLVVNLKTEDGKELCIALEKMKHLSTLDVVADKYLDLDHMQCPPLYLQHLYLRGRPLRLPMWISKLTSLQKLRLEGSDRLNTNPLDVLEDLPNLMELHLVGYYRGVKKLVFRAYTFKKLVKLNIENFYELNSMVFEEGALPVLRQLDIFRCPNLESLNCDLTVLWKLSIYHCPNLKSLQCDLPVLRELTISDCPNLESLQCDLPALRELDIFYCLPKSLQCDLPVLRELTIYHRPNLESFPMWISKLTSLQKLSLQEPHQLNTKPLDVLEDLPDQLNTNPLDVLEDFPNLMELNLVGYYRGVKKLVFRAYTFKKLVKLNIQNFYELNSMVFEEGALPVLRQLTIFRCPNLESLSCDLTVLRKLSISDCPNLNSEVSSM